MIKKGVQLMFCISNGRAFDVEIFKQCMNGYFLYDMMRLIYKGGTLYLMRSIAIHDRETCWYVFPSNAIPGAFVGF